MNATLNSAEVDEYVLELRRRVFVDSVRIESMTRAVEAELARIAHELRAGREPDKHEDLDRVVWAIRRTSA